MDETKHLTSDGVVLRKSTELGHKPAVDDKTSNISSFNSEKVQFIHKTLD